MTAKAFLKIAEGLKDVTGHKFQLKGFRINKKTGMPERIPNFGLNASAKQKQRSSKRVRPVKRGKTP